MGHRFVWLSLILALSRPCPAWDTLPHQRITKAALDALPKQLLTKFGAEVQPLIDIYCILPDRYEEMDRYGFVRKGQGPQSVAEIKVYCVRPDGQRVHGATGDRESDTASLVYLLEGIVSSERASAAARYAGVLSHFIEDSLSPPHAIDADRLLQMTPVSPQGSRINMHAAIERSIPEFSLGDRAPRLLPGDLPAVAKAIVMQCYDGAQMNRASLPAMVMAVSGHDETTLNEYRLRAGRKAAEILADGLFTVLRIAEPAHPAPKLPNLE